MSSIPGYTIVAAAIMWLREHVTDEVAARPILRGIYLRPDGVAMATDGKTLAMWREAHTSTVADWLELPDKGITTAQLRKADRDGVELFVANDMLRFYDRSYQLLSTYDRQVYARDYPNLSQVLPKPGGKTVSLPEIGIQPALLARFPGFARLRFQGEHKAIAVTCEDYPNLYGLVMPVRIDPEDFPLGMCPDWARGA